MGVAPEIPRLTPEMASRKNQVMVFIRLYWDAHGASPSIGEIAAAVGCARSRAQAAVRKLAREGRLHHVPGATRSLMPIERHDAAIALLRARGWTVDPGRRMIAAPDADGTGTLDIGDDGAVRIVRGTNACLPPDPVHAHDARAAGDRADGQAGADGQGRQGEDG